MRCHPLVLKRPPLNPSPVQPIVSIAWGEGMKPGKTKNKLLWAPKTSFCRLLNSQALEWLAKNGKYLHKEDVYAGVLLRFVLRESLHLYTG